MKLYTIIFLLGILTRIKALSYNFTYENQLRSCIRNIGKAYTRSRNLILYDDDVYDVVNQLHMIENTTFRVYRVDSHSDPHHKRIANQLLYFSNYVIVQNFTRLKQALHLIHHMDYFSSRSRYVIVYQGPIDDLDAIFVETWRFYLQQVLVISSDLAVYTYNPLASKFCNNTKKHLLVKNCHGSKHNLRSPSRLRVLYFEECPLNIYAYPIVPYVFKKDYQANDGFEMKILKEIVSRVRMTPIYHNHTMANWGIKLPDGSYTLLYKKLQDRQADILLGSTGMTYDRILDFDYTYVHCLAELSFYVPLSKLEDRWKHLFLIFRDSIWGMLFASIVLMVALSYYIIRRDLIARLQDLLQILLSVSYLRPQTLAQRYIFILWTYYALIVTTFYQSQMVSVLYSPIRQHQISTLHELVNSNLRFGGYSGNNFNKSNWLFQKIYRRWIPCSLGADDCLHWLFNLEDYGYWKNVRTLNYEMSTNKSRQAFRIPFSSTSLVTMYLPRGSPYKNRFDDLIRRLFQNGLIVYWDVYLRQPKMVTQPPALTQLNFHHILGVFVIWAGGCFVALMVFIGELVVQRLRKPKRKMLHFYH